MGRLCSGLTFPVSCLILVWVGGSGKSPTPIHSFIGPLIQQMFTGPLDARLLG